MIINRIATRNTNVISSALQSKVAEKCYHSIGKSSSILLSPSSALENVDIDTSHDLTLHHATTSNNNDKGLGKCQKTIINNLTQQQTKTIEETVPWFMNNMPSCYFRSVPEQFRMDHIKALSAIQDANLDLHMNLKSHLPGGHLILTYIRPGKEAGRLLNLVKDLPWNFDSEEYLPLSRVQVFTSEDETMSLSMFVYGGKTPVPTSFDAKNVGRRILDYAKQLQNGDFNNGSNVPPPSHIFEEENLIEYFQKCEETYLMRCSPRRFLKQRELYEKVTGTECMAVSVEETNLDAPGPGDYWVDIAVANSLPQIALENATRVLFQHQFDVVRSHLDMISDGDNGTVCMLRMLISPMYEENIPMTNSKIEIITNELKRTKWLDPKTMELVFKNYPWIGLLKGEVITCFCSLLHPIMTKKNSYAFSMGNIFNIITSPRYIPYAESIAELFLDKFNPDNPLGQDILQQRSDEIISKVSEEVEDTVAKELLLKMVDIIKHTLKTNAYIENRYSLGLRLDPRIMEQEEIQREVPYGIMFSHGRRFNAFHVRFRDIARGGMRLVTPSSEEQHALESARHYEECYDLAFSQQLKNKDIPEGGSKAVNLIDCHGLSEDAKQFVMRKSVKAFVNTIFDLIVEDDETKCKTVDYLNKKEVIYLGPDEQVTVDDINWIVERAAKRGYDTPNAFMSSKPRAGINHKEYGVTSEGVNTYLDVALQRVLGINPKTEKFTIKMTGGPDGDVAGNEIKILIREYGDNVKIVGISDASGCAEDPNGLDHEELICLVDRGLSISNFSPSKLSSDGELFLTDNEDGINKRNTMHNRLITDAFVPAGGRPGTIDITNYRKYLQEDGSPSSPLIVEGANLFITGDARQALYDEGNVVIVKDSSANKCGVITSSYEICAAMLLDDEEFYSNKEQIVAEVIEKLQELAKMEAELLFKEFESHKGSLPEVSQKISNSINSATDALIDKLPAEDIETLLPLFRDHLPKTLSDLAFNKVKDSVPNQYIINAIASCLASKMVYKEGCNFIDSLPRKELMTIAMKYITKEKEIAQLKVSLSESNISQEEKDMIIRILDEGGVRTSLTF